jgi:hypothetical protein
MNNNQIQWQKLTAEQRNKVIAEKVMNATRVRDKTLLPESKKKIPDYTTNFNAACLILLTFTGTEFSYQTDEDLAHISVKIDNVELSFRGGAGEECAEAICIAALQAVGLEVELQS